MGLFFKKKNKGKSEVNADTKVEKNEGMDAVKQGETDSPGGGIPDQEAGQAGGNKVKVMDSRGEYLWNSIDDFSRSSNKEVRSNLQIPGFYMGSGKNIPEMSDEATEELLADIRSGSTEVHIDDLKIGRSKEDFEPAQYQRRRRSSRKAEDNSQESGPVKLTAQEKYDISRGRSRLDPGLMETAGAGEGQPGHSAKTGKEPLMEKEAGKDQQEKKSAAAAKVHKKEKALVTAEVPKEEKGAATVEVPKEEKGALTAEVPGGEKSAAAVEVSKEEKGALTVEVSEEEKSAEIVEVPEEEKGALTVEVSKEEKSAEAEEGQTAGKPAEAEEGQTADKLPEEAEAREEFSQEDKWGSEEEDDDDDEDSGDMDSAGRSILSMLFSLFLVGLVVVFVFSFNRFLKGRTYHKLEMSPELGLEDQYNANVQYLNLDKDFLSCFIVIKELPQEGISEDLIPGKKTNSSVPVKSGQIMRASCRGNYQDKKYYQLENGMYITANGKNVEPLFLYVPVSGSLAITHVSSKGVQLRLWPDFKSETNMVRSVFVGDVVNVTGRLVLSDGKTGAYVTDEGYFIIDNEKYFEAHVKDPSKPAAAEEKQETKEDNKENNKEEKKEDNKEENKEDNKEKTE